MRAFLFILLLLNLAGRTVSAIPATGSWVRDEQEQERDGSNGVMASYVLGLDVSGMREGAGGIGGILARNQGGPSATGRTFCHSDAQGNVTALINQGQAVVASYNYDPFGRDNGMSGWMAPVNKYRFSSKEYHAASATYSYGYRHYLPEVQRWGQREPLGEGVDIYLYRPMFNAPTRWWDYLGLDPDSNLSMRAEYGIGVSNEFTDPETGETLTGGELARRVGDAVVEEAVMSGVTGAAGKLLSGIGRGAGKLAGKLKDWVCPAKVAKTPFLRPDIVLSGGRNGRISVSLRFLAPYALFVARWDGQ